MSSRDNDEPSHLPAPSLRVQSLPSSPCGSATNTTCICGNEDLRGRFQDCIVANCTGPDAISKSIH
ncbi:hypothetical protein MAPG_11314 [Magnaporthiopsis poae ATCC 64411]|uniref:CFEM domain-containing protein n=1 Tax=Magnaporthiopsis poae (strain ATCC 64411 / 73-15) TaxID=644358 RepID=A0A0C4EEY2_MAGP6|nr:hypothetical protein MAPG_11314 [Magnaporthiopsis poae ATCC 64411]